LLDEYAHDPFRRSSAASAYKTAVAIFSSSVHQ